MVVSAAAFEAISVLKAEAAGARKDATKTKVMRIQLDLKWWNMFRKGFFSNAPWGPFEAG